MGHPSWPPTPPPTFMFSLSNKPKNETFCQNLDHFCMILVFRLPHQFWLFLGHFGQLWRGGLTQGGPGVATNDVFPLIYTMPHVKNREASVQIMNTNWNCIPLYYCVHTFQLFKQLPKLKEFVNHAKQSVYHAQTVGLSGQQSVFRSNSPFATQ